MKYMDWDNMDWDNMDWDNMDWDNMHTRLETYESFREMRGEAENVSMNLYVQKRTDAVGRLW